MTSPANVYVMPVQEEPEANTENVRPVVPERAKTPSGMAVFEQLPGIQRQLSEIRELAEFGLETLAIRGDSGVGKSFAARLYHNHSRRSRGPFIEVNAAELPESLFEASMFGSKRGSFTGAVADRNGHMHVAHRGTLFLDEVGEISLTMQPKLLRCVEKREFLPVGGTRTESVGCNIVAATNRDLRKMVSDGTFREDLLFRFEHEVVIPPLRDRPEDIEPLAKYLMAEISSEREFEIESGFFDRLRALPLRGNVRELQNLLMRAFVRGKGNFRLAFFGEQVERPASEKAEVSAAVEVNPGLPTIATVAGSGRADDVQFAHAIQVFESCYGNNTRTAAVLGIALKTWHNWKKYYRANPARAAMLDRVEGPKGIPARSKS